MIETLFGRASLVVPRGLSDSGDETVSCYFRSSLPRLAGW
jgi:hypothetical protein